MFRGAEMYPLSLLKTESVMKKETWKMIPGYEGLYMVSNKGRVKNFRTGRILRQHKTNCGYFGVTLSKNGKVKLFSVHRLVAMAFIPNPYNLPEVNHINEDKTDNRVENLEWCTPEYNRNYGTRLKRVSGKLSKPIEQWSLDGKLIKVWPSAAEVRRQLGFDSSTITKCCRLKQKTAYGFIWRYHSL